MSGKMGPPCFSIDLKKCELAASTCVLYILPAPPPKPPIDDFLGRPRPLPTVNVAIGFPSGPLACLFFK